VTKTAKFPLCPPVQTYRPRFIFYFMRYLQDQMYKSRAA